MFQHPLKRTTIFLQALLLMALTMGSAWAQTYDLCAGETTMTMPDGQSVTVWGFGMDTGGACTPTVPGPTLRVDPADPSLVINLRNTLTEPVSLHILGQPLGNNGGPVWDGGIIGGRPNETARVRSFSHEAAGNGGTAQYEWNPLRAGTYLLQSGTDPAKQVQMGLFAPVVKDSAAGVAYADDPDIAGDQSVSYDQELILVFHEIDPAIHSAVAAGTYGPGGTITSSVYRDAQYFLINGMGYPDPALDPIFAFTPGDRVLLRILNGGAMTHAPQILNGYLTQVAVDGNPLSYAKETYAIELPAASTVDVVLDNISGKIAVLDGRLNLSNAGAAPGGMLAYLQAGDTVTITKANYVADTEKLKIRASSSDPGAVLTAEALYGTTFVTLGIVPTDNTEVVFRLAAEPSAVRITSSGGGSATAALGGTTDTVTINKATYVVDTEKLKVQAYSDYPPSSVTLTAEAIYLTTPVTLGTVPADNTQRVFRLSAQPTSVRVSSTSGGTDTVVLGGIDTVTITKATYDPATTKLKIQAYTNFPYESVTLTAEAITGGVPTTLGTVPSNSDQQVFRLPAKPDEVRVTSTGGGSSTLAVP